MKEKGERQTREERVRVSFYCERMPAAVSSKHTTWHSLFRFKPRKKENEENRKKN